MIDSYGRSSYQKVIIDPILPLFSFLSPASVSYLALFSGISILPLLALKHSGFAFLMLIASGFFDTLDGSIARFKNQTTPFGAALDITGDRVVEFSVILGLYFFDPERALSCLLMLGSILICITSFLVVGIFTPNDKEKSFHYSPGLVERGEAFIFFLDNDVASRDFLFYLFSIFSTGACDGNPPSLAV